MPKIAVVTGASSGIGFELVKKLAAEGLTVYAIARREPELGVLQSLYPDHIRIIAADLSTEAGILEIVDELEKEFSIDYLVNNAGILGVKALEDSSYGEVQTLLNTNVLAPTFLTSQLAKKKCFNSGGRVINISSRAASSFSEGLAAYCMSKAALNVLTAMISMELFPRGEVLATSFIPGEVETLMQEQLRAFPPLAEAFQAAQSAGKLISPELSAQCLTWMLLSAAPEQFLDISSIYNTKYQAEWLKPGQSMPDPQAGMSGLPEVIISSGLRSASSTAFQAYHDGGYLEDHPVDLRHEIGWSSE